MKQRVPTLWQIKISHYNEKARWALDYKRVPHRRRTPPPLFGSAPIALALTGQVTFPVLRLNGESIGDSTRIIAALEERYPEPPLYPSATAERARALALEDFFDEELAPHVRRLAWNAATKDPRVFTASAMPDSGTMARAVVRGGSSLTAPLVRRRYGANEEAVRTARERVVASMRRLEAELGPRDYLVGDSFSVADLSGAALFTPLLRPPQRAYLPDLEFPPPLAQFCRELSEMPGSAWVHEMFRRHRGTSAEIR